MSWIIAAALAALIGVAALSWLSPAKAASQANAECSPLYCEFWLATTSALMLAEERT